MKEQVAQSSFWKVEGRSINTVWEEERTGPIFAEGYFEPPIDVYQTDNEIVVKVEIPGVRKKDIHVDFLEGVLVIRGLREDITGERKLAYHQMEINYGIFERRIRIYVPVEKDKISAHYKNGFLGVRLPLRRGE